MVEYKITLDLTKNGIQKQINIKAGEKNSRKLIVTLVQSGKIYELNDSCAKIYFDTGEFREVDIVGNTVEFVLPDAFAQAQVRICELKLCSEDGSILFSPMFELIVEESIGNHPEGVPLGERVYYQELLANADVQEEEFTDEDYFIIYDSSQKKTLKLPRKEVSGNVEELIAELEEKINNDLESIHEHANKDEILDKLSKDEDGNLLYDGKQINSEGQLSDNPTDIFYPSDGFFSLSDDVYGGVFYASASPIIGKKIKAIYVTYKGTRIDIRDFPAYDLAAVAVNYNKVIHVPEYNSEFIFSAVAPYAMNSQLILNMSNYDFMNVEIEYYL